MTRKGNKRKNSDYRKRRRTGGATGRHVAALEPGLQAQARGDLHEAEASFKQVIERHPQLVDAHVALATLLARQERLLEAESWLKKAIELRPNVVAPRLVLAELYRSFARPRQAVDTMMDCIDRFRHDAEAHYQLGFAQLAVGDLEQGAENLKHALRLNADHIDARLRLGQALHVRKDARGAESAFRELLRRQPDHGRAWLGLGQVLMRAGNVKEARECFLRAMTLNPTLPDLSTAVARSKRYTQDDAEEVERLIELSAESRRWPDVRADYRFALGKVMDDLKRYDEAFEYYAEGNRLAREQRNRFDLEQLTLVVDRIMQTFSVEYFADHDSIGDPSAVPVFVVGMQRSGTTLAEQILASHPAVFGADELPYIDDLSHQLAGLLRADVSYPRCASLLTAEVARELAGEYLSRIREISADAQRIVDKMPGNLFHAGFIASLFPNAKIVHCRRDPLDVSLSIFFQQFESGHEWAYSLEEIAAYYCEYQRAVSHWRKVLPIQIFELEYENLIANQESVTRELIDYCGLPWDAQCLEYFQTRRQVGSASNWQVRQPIYTRSVARWKHYEPYLQVLKSRLEPVLSTQHPVYTP